MGVWADYLRLTGDTSFVSQFFHDDASGSSPWGPSLFTIAHTEYQSQLNADGTLVTNNDNDSSGRWLFSNYSALEMLASYKYIATVLGMTSEAQYADTAYTKLLNSLNTVVGSDESTNGFSFLPCTVNQPDSANRCGTFNDANWASPAWIGQNQWSTMLMGGTLNGIIGDPAQIDAMYAFGFARLASQQPAVPDVRRVQRLLHRVQHRVLRTTACSATTTATCRSPATPGRSRPRPAGRTPGGRPTAAVPTRPTRGPETTPRRSSAPARTPGRSQPSNSACSSRSSRPA